MPEEKPKDLVPLTTNDIEETVNPKKHRTKLKTILAFIKKYVIPFVRRHWKPLGIAGIALVVLIWLIVNVGFGDTISLLFVGGIFVLIVYVVVRNNIRKEEDVEKNVEEEVVVVKEEDVDRKKRSKRRSYTKERQMLWLWLNRKHGKNKVNCTYCRKPIHRLDRNVHLDHKVPLSVGGTNELSNMHLVHASCNERKGTTSHKEWMQNLAQERQKLQYKR